MILFDLACRPEGHVFEGWFASTEAYQDQRSRGLLTCPLCGAADVDKAVMAPRISTGGDRPSLPPEAAKAMLTRLAAAQAKMLDGSDYVGDRFAAEARAIHEGERPDRLIHGRATVQEAQELHADGIPVAPLPLPVRPPGTDN